MKEAIKLAIKGGYLVRKSAPKTTFNDISGSKAWQCYLLLDPDFWKCLGKQQGWENTIEGLGWINKWHDFIDALSQGKTADKFFNNLLIKANG